MGLAIVMVLVTVGILFVITFTFNDPGDDAATQFLTDQFSQNILDAYLKSTHPACPAEDVTRYFVWYINNDGPESCREEATWDDILEGQIRNALDLYVGRDYLFVVRDRVCPQAFGCEEREVFRSGACNPELSGVGRAGRQVIPLYPSPDSAEIVLWLCEPQ